MVGGDFVSLTLPDEILLREGVSGSAGLVKVSVI